MTDRKTRANGVRNHTDDSPHTHGRWTEVLKHRWPTALGVAVAALAAFDMASGLEFAALTVLMALVYLGAAALDRRWCAWVVLLAGLPLTIFIPSIYGIESSAVLLVAGLVFLVLGVVLGKWRSPGGLPLQTVGMLVFGSIVLATLYVGPEVGSYLVAFAILGHAGWDAIHYLRNKIVPRSYAEFCFFVDLLLGAAILFMV
jgi:hypothetical protein